LRLHHVGREAPDERGEEKDLRGLGDEKRSGKKRQGGIGEEIFGSVFCASGEAVICKAAGKITEDREKEGGASGDEPPNLDDVLHSFVRFFLRFDAQMPLVKIRGQVGDSFRGDPAHQLL